MGVSKDVVEEALDGLDEEESAYRAGGRTLGRLRRLDYYTFRKRMFAYLRRRGFGGEVVSRTILRLWGELSDPPESHKDGYTQAEQPKDRRQEAADNGK